MAVFRCGSSALLLTFVLVSSSFGVAGVGIHWGNDFTLRMEDVEQEWLSFDNLSIGDSGITGNLPPQLAGAITGKDLPIFLTRTDWKRTMINGGLKIYVDVIPVLDVVELSTNFGLWEYEGSITYPVGLTVVDNVNYATATNPEDIFTPVYDTIPFTLENYGAGFGTLRKTPYMKLGFDLTVRKFIFQFPPMVKMLKLYGGGGLSLNFATPVISKSLIEDAINANLESAATLTDLSLFSNEEVIEAVIKEILGNLMTPHFGLHLDLGVMIKIPVIPLGFYVDGRFLIPFDNMDPNVDLGGFGILLNSGISLSF
ncbi:MAG: hypothetical protein JXA18_13965 [Chitinispirillaceae bacterium]|nr:hypothetical protein [Chitinispirillaceae bacterium]